MIENIIKTNYWNNEKIETGFCRDLYTNNINKYLGNRLIKVLVGQRRVGKSYIMRMIIHKLINDLKISPKNILYLNKEYQELDYINNSNALFEALNKYLHDKKQDEKLYIFIDEIQEIDGWEKTVNSFSQNHKYDMEFFITGSNSHLLSGELATFLTGRYINFEIFPFSYKEYLTIKKLVNNKANFIQYLQEGGMPELFKLSEYELKRSYISILKDSIIYKDIIKRHSIREPHVLDKIFEFISDSIGSLCSVTSICNHYKSHGIKINPETISSYLNFLEQAFLIHSSPRFEIKGKKILTGEKKYYLNDLAFRTLLFSHLDIGIGKLLENCIYLHLKRQGNKVYTGKVNNYEVDFVCEKNKIREYIQVAYILADKEVIEREFRSLELIKDNYKKYVITLDDFSLGNKNGIEHVTAWEFLYKS